jgi:hypothetical protein
MSKFKLIAMIALPSLSVLAALLETKDENPTGVDDELAAALKHLISRLQLYLSQPDA